MEGVWVGHVVDQHNEVGFAQQLECDLLENVLARNVNQVKLHSLIRLALNSHFLYVVLATLGHEVVVIESAFDYLVD